MARGVNMASYREAPPACWCGVALTKRQRQRWAYRARKRRLEGRPAPEPPSCTASHALMHRHLVEPELAYKVGRASFLKRRDRLFVYRATETCSLPPGPERDRALYQMGYKAGLHAKNRAERRRALAKALAPEARDYRIAGGEDG